MCTPLLSPSHPIPGLHTARAVRGADHTVSALTFSINLLVNLPGTKWEQCSIQWLVKTTFLLNGQRDFVCLLRQTHSNPGQCSINFVVQAGLKLKEVFLSLPPSAKTTGMKITLLVRFVCIHFISKRNEHLTGPLSPTLSFQWYDVSQVDPELLTPLPPECWDYKFVPPCWFTEDWTRCSMHTRQAPCQFFLMGNIYF